MSYCDKIISNFLKDEMNENYCDFCDVKLVDNIIVKQKDPCCKNKMALNKDNDMNCCKSCGVVNGNDLQPPYIDFHENKYKFKKKICVLKLLYFKRYQ